MTIATQEVMTQEMTKQDAASQEVIPQKNVIHETTAQPPAANRLRGRILNLHTTRGYAFVQVDDGREFFLHASAIKGGAASLRRDVLVEFTPVMLGLSHKKDRAIKAVVME